MDLNQEKSEIKEGVDNKNVEIKQDVKAVTEIKDDINNALEKITEKSSLVSAMENYERVLFENDGLLITEADDDIVTYGNDDIQVSILERMILGGKKNLLNPMTCIGQGKGHKVHAIFVDKEGGKQDIGIRLQFGENNITEYIYLKQSELWKCAKYLYAIAENKGRKTENMAENKRSFDKFRERIFDYQQKGSTISPENIILAIFENYNEIREEKQIKDLEKLGKVYKVIYEKVRLYDSIDRAFVIGKENAQYYRVFPYLFNEMAFELKMSPLELARYLSEMGFLITPKYSAGYEIKAHYPFAYDSKGELKVAEDGENRKEWVYAILKPEHFTSTQKYDTDMT